MDEHSLDLERSGVVSETVPLLKCVSSQFPYFKTCLLNTTGCFTLSTFQGFKLKSGSILLFFTLDSGQLVLAIQGIVEKLSIPALNALLLLLIHVQYYDALIVCRED